MQENSLDEYKQQVADYFNSRTNYDRSDRRGAGERLYEGNLEFRI